MRMRQRMLPVTMAALVTVMTVLTGCGGERGNGGSDAGGGRLSIATGNTTGVYYQLGGGYARLIGQYVPGWTATAEATGASVENLRRVVAGDSDVAFTLADSAADAVNGKTYEAWATKATETFSSRNFTGTPTIVVAGKLVEGPNHTLPTLEMFTQAVNQAAG